MDSNTTVQERTPAESASDEPACARCGRLTPRALMGAWRERERYRVFSRRPGEAARATGGQFRYVYEYKEHLICPACRRGLTRGGAIADPARRRAVVILIAAIVLAVAAALLTPVVLPQLLSAFWQTH